MNFKKKIYCLFVTLKVMYLCMIYHLSSCILKIKLVRYIIKSSLSLPIFLFLWCGILMTSMALNIVLCVARHLAMQPHSSSHQEMESVSPCFGFRLAFCFVLADGIQQKQWCAYFVPRLQTIVCFCFLSGALTMLCGQAQASLLGGEKLGGGDNSF